MIKKHFNVVPDQLMNQTTLFNQFVHIWVKSEARARIHKRYVEAEKMSFHQWLSFAYS
jgi:hypothetical protein